MTQPEKRRFDTPEWQRRFRNLLTDIKQQKCVVFLGPEIVKLNGTTVRQALRDHLNATNADDIVHYYDRDGFFLFREKIAKQEVQYEIAEFYKNYRNALAMDDTLINKLVQLKTHLLVSINPDNILSEVAHKHAINHQFAYFKHGGGAVEQVGKPTLEMPLYYNLFGSIEHFDSMVLDYEDLFSLLSSLIGTPGLPDALRTVLSETKVFLFIGFDFDKWYSPLLLRLLSGKKGNRKYVIDPSVKEENTTTFLVKHFGIEFIEDEAAFLDELFRQCALQGLMHDIVEAHTPEVVQVKRHIQKGEILKALTFAYANTQNDDAKHILTVRLGEFNDLQERQQKGMVDSRDYSVQLNKIIDALLKTIKDGF